ncbi:MAG: YigZ family protein [Rhodococcus sp. (in: high G+C Gram-positive bacteria)]
MFRTVADTARAEIEIKKSRFLAVVARAQSEEEARAVIAAARSDNRAARHYCSAILVGDGVENRTVRSSDDGEPSGTAGMPMLEVLTGRELTNVVAVVTRWFGGIKLGTGGLARAYSGAVAEALQHARFLRRERRELVRVDLDHSDLGRIESDMRGRGVEIVSIEYHAHAVLTMAVADPDAIFASLAGLTAGNAKPRLVGTTYVEIPE